jgi:phosphopantetheinyl transferase
MAILQKEMGAERAMGIWKIEEEEETLISQAAALEGIPDRLRHPERRLEFVAGRVLVRHLVESLGQPYHGITSNEHGKPLLVNSSAHVSITHSFPYVAALVDLHKPAGIDLEPVNPKLLKMAPRLFHVNELRDAGRNPVKHTIFWSGKETLMKIYGKKDLVFAENLLIDPFSLNRQGGDLTGHIVLENQTTDVLMSYRLFDDHVLVFTR